MINANKKQTSSKFFITNEKIFAKNAKNAKLRFFNY
jgi:hypothetical protein